MEPQWLRFHLCFRFIRQCAYYLLLFLPPAPPAFCFVPDDKLTAFRAGGLMHLSIEKGIDAVIFHVLQLIGKTAFTGFGIGRACSAEQAADAGYMIRYFFHKEYLLHGNSPHS